MNDKPADRGASGKFVTLYPKSAAEARAIVFPYWYRGSAGLGTTVARFVALGESDLAAALGELVLACSYRYTVMPGLFFGLAGFGNFLLDCHQLLGEEHYLDSARRTADGLTLFAIERPEGIAFPGEDLYRITLDFGTGTAGIALLLHRFATGGPNFNLVPDGLLRARTPPTQAAPASAIVR